MLRFEITAWLRIVHTPGPTGASMIRDKVRDSWPMASAIRLVLINGAKMVPGGHTYVYVALSTVYSGVRWVGHTPNNSHI